MKIALAATIASLTALLASTPAMAEPTYLACVLPIDDKSERIDFTADEQAGTVSILIGSSGSSRTVNATFTPDKVIVDEPSARWEISRTDLSFSRTIKMISSMTTGQCEIQAPPERAF